jgi:hypothetical protein
MTAMAVTIRGNSRKNSGWNVGVDTRPSDVATGLVVLDMLNASCLSYLIFRIAGTVSSCDKTDIRSMVVFQAEK